MDSLSNITYKSYLEFGQCYIVIQQQKLQRKDWNFIKKNDSQIEMVMPDKKQDSLEENFFVFEYLCCNVQ